MQTVAKEFDVQAMPTFVYMKGEEKLDKVVGASKDDIEAKLVKHTQVSAAWLYRFFFYLFANMFGVLIIIHVAFRLSHLRGAYMPWVCE